MFKTMLSIFTGSSGWLYIALLVLGLGFIGTSWLSVGLLEDKAGLHVNVAEKEKLIKEKEELIEAQVKEIKRLDKELSQTKSDLQMQNALNEQYAIDIEKAKKAHEEAMAKKPLFRTQYVTTERTKDEAIDLFNFVKTWRTQK